MIDEELLVAVMDFMEAYPSVRVLDVMAEFDLGQEETLDLLREARRRILIREAERGTVGE